MPSRPLRTTRRAWFRIATLAGATATVVLAPTVPNQAVAILAARPGLASANPSACSGPVAPYVYGTWGHPQKPATVIAETGVRCFTAAFILDRGRCRAGWDDRSPLTRGADAALVNSIRRAGGDIIPSSGGASNTTSLEADCPNATALAGAYSRIVTTLGVRSLDLDVEGHAIASPAVRSRVLTAISELHHTDPAVRVNITVPVNLTDLSAPTTAFITAAARHHVPVASWSLMPFDNGNARTNMSTAATDAADELHRLLRRLHPAATNRALWAHEGLSLLNGHSDTGDNTSLAAFRVITRFARSHQLARLTFWAVNRDRPCPNGSNDSSVCSGTSAARFSFTKIVAADR